MGGQHASRVDLFRPFISKEIKNETSSKLDTEEIEALALRYLTAKTEKQNTIMIIGTGILGKSLVEESSRSYKNDLVLSS